MRAILARIYPACIYELDSGLMSGGKQHNRMISLYAHQQTIVHASCALGRGKRTSESHWSGDDRHQKSVIIRSPVKSLEIDVNRRFRTAMMSFLDEFSLVMM